MSRIVEQTVDPLEEVRELMAACMQCGTCSASCPNQAFMDVTPRRLWRLAQLGFVDEMLATKSFWMCSACYTCTMRCPRGLPVTEVMYALKRLAEERNVAGSRRRSAFYRSFVDNLRRYGRIQEVPLVNRYLARMGDPLLALSYIPTGLKLARKGKLHAPSSAHKGALGPVFARMKDMAAEKEART